MLPLATFSVAQEHAVLSSDVKFVATPLKRDTADFVQSPVPQFPGGSAAMKKYIEENLRYPEKMKNSGVQGKVYLSFMVDREGAINTVDLLRGVHPELDEEAIRLVRSFPLFIPAYKEGRPIAAEMKLPISFVLEDKK